MKFPYGISDFDSLITRQFHYVDRTDYIPLLEEAGDQLLFLRPRRFGKSLLLSMLENYYDINKTDRFDALFGNLAIGGNPTTEHNRYFVLKWDFSEVSPTGDGEEIQRTLYRYLNLRIGAFSDYYREMLDDPIRIEPEDALASFQSLLNDALYQRGDMQPLCDFMEQKYFKVFSNRDYAQVNELIVKTAFLTLLFDDTLYIMESEAEIERGHTDLTLIVRPDMRQYPVLDILIAFKFVSLAEAGLDGKALEPMDRGLLAALSAVQRKQREAEEGLVRYREKLKHKFGDALRLRSFSVVAVGFERLVFSPWG